MDNSEQNAQQSYEELCLKYGKPKSIFKGTIKIPPLQLICGIVAAVTFLLLIILTFSCYSRTIVFMGGKATFGKTVSIVTFIKDGWQAIVTQFEGIINLDVSDILGIMNMLQQAVAIIFSIVLCIAQAVLIIIAVVKIVQKQMYQLPRVLLASIKWNMSAYAVFTFFCNITGGTGENFYYVGDVAGLGLNIGMILAVCGLIACGVLCCLDKKEYIISHNLKIR